MDRSRLSACHHHPDRQRRTARRHHRPPSAAAHRHPALHAGLDPLRRRADTMADDCRARCAGSGCGHHDGAHHGLCRRNRAEGEDRERHGAARNDVSDRHRSWAFARRPADRRARLAGNLSRQRAARHSDLRSRLSPPACRYQQGEDGSEGLRHGGHAAACADALGLCAGDDDRARPLWPAQHRSALVCRASASVSSSSPRRERHRR